MRWRTGQLGARGLALSVALGFGAGLDVWAQPAGPAGPAGPRQGEADRPGRGDRGGAEGLPEAEDRLVALDQLTGACLSFQQEVRELRRRLREDVALLEARRGVLEETAKLLASPADEAGAERWRGVAAQVQQEASEVRRWLRGEDRPDQPGLTRVMLRLRLDELSVAYRDAVLRAHAYELADPAQRADFRRAVLDRAQALREQAQAVTQPLRERLAQLDTDAAQQGEPFEEAMSGIGRLGGDGPIAVMAVRADGWFEHGLVSYRWTDRRGQLIASAQVRVLPHADRDTTAPLLLGRFPILGQSEQEADLHVGHFAIEFHAAAEELLGEERVLQAVARLLDLDTLARVRPTGAAPGQN